jgi:hypothetical protein
MLLLAGRWDSNIKTATLIVFMHLIVMGVALSAAVMLVMIQVIERMKYLPKY